MYIVITDLGEKEIKHIIETLPEGIDWNFIYVPEELFADFEGNYFMGCTNTKVPLQKFNQVRLGIDVEKDVPYINTGVLMMNLPLLRENLNFEDICEFSEKKKQMLILPDQDILTALYGEHVKLIDNLRYNLSDRTLLAYNADPQKGNVDEVWVRKNTSIIHYFGRNKPWKKKYVGILDVFYEELEEEYAEEKVLEKNSEKHKICFSTTLP